MQKWIRGTLRDRLLGHRRIENGCWIWDGSTSYGYGRIRVNGKTAYVHRVAYEEWVSPIPEGLTIDHLCRHRACFNPKHLEVVSSRMNVLRGKTVAAANSERTHCKHGHPLNGDNLYLYIRKNGRAYRQCRECNKKTARNWRLARLKM